MVAMLLAAVLLGGGVMKLPAVLVEMGESDELKERCLPIKIFSTVKLEMDLLGGFLELESSFDSSNAGEPQLAPWLLELLAAVDSSLLDVDPKGKRPFPLTSAGESPPA